MIYLFEQFTIDTGQYQLSLEGNPVPVEPLAFDLLVYLIENRERVVGRDELLENLWKGKVVTDAALAARLKDVRKALGDSGSKQEFVKTVHGRGYQFIAPIVESGKVDPMLTVEKIITGHNLDIPAKPSIAVLPLQNVSEDIEAEYFSDGVSDGIVNGLTRFRDLFVMGRSSSFSFRDKPVDTPEIGRQLGVRYVVQGVVRKLGERVRVSVELVDAETGQNLWSDHYDRELKDVFVVEDEVAQAIVATLVTQVEDAVIHQTKSRAPENLEAYEWLLQGNRFVESGGKENLLEARRMYQQALALDPNFSAAYAGLSKSYQDEHWGHLAEDYDEVLKRCLEFGQKAVELDDKDCRAHCAVGNAYLSAGRHDLAGFHLEKALALNPGEYHNLCFKGYLLAFTGRHEESRLCLSDSMRHNPLAPNSCLFALGMSDYLAGRYEEATMMLTRLESESLRKFSCLAASYAQLGHDGEARAAAAEFRNLIEENLASELGDDYSKWRDYWTRVFSFFRPADVEHLLEGLRKAGLPD
jgi:TolB-like protein/tetratricopeptide (TPR) repeat protein